MGDFLREPLNESAVRFLQGQEGYAMSTEITPQDYILNERNWVSKFNRRLGLFKFLKKLVKAIVKVIVNICFPIPALGDPKYIIGPINKELI